MNTAAKVAEQKRQHPERYCPEPRCLWRTGGGWCPRHAPRVHATPAPINGETARRGETLGELVAAPAVVEARP